MARIGKIARLPLEVRDALNARLRDGEPGRPLLRWLNELPAARRILDDYFEGKAINAQNLSDWRMGGYREWLQKHDRHLQRVARTKELASMSMELARSSGGNLSEGASAMLGGAILDVLESLEGARTQAEETGDAGARLASMSAALAELTHAVTRLRQGDQVNRRIEQKDEELALAREQFAQRLQEYRDKVTEQKRAIEGALGAAKDGGLAPETLARLEEAVGLL